MSYTLGVDLGTSGVKALLLSENGNVADIARENYSIDVPVKGYAEQNPKVWVEKTFKVIRDVLDNTGISPESIESIAFSGQMHGVVLLDENYIPLRPAIIWSDQRSSRQVEYINNSIGKQKLGKLTSNPLFTGFYGVTLMWIKEKEPDVYKKARVALLPKDYLRFVFTGEIGTEVTDASGTGIFDVSMAKWSEYMVDFLGIKRELIPNCYKSNDVAGVVRENVSEETRLKKGTKVVFGGADHAMQALGTGVINPGVLAINIGSGGQIYSPVQSSTYDFKLRMHKFCNIVPGVWDVMGATLSAGLSLNWFVNNVLKLENYDVIERVGDNSSPGSDGLFFIPYIAGERTPHMDPNATGMFFGLALKHDQADMLRAVMEGVSYSFRECYEIFGKMGIKTSKLITAGGGAKNRLWRQIIADMFECEVYNIKASEEAALGAAMLAGVCVGVYSSYEDAVKTCVNISDDVVSPCEENFSKYREGFEVFKKMYRKSCLV